jgi:hypothetical protein
VFRQKSATTIAKEGETASSKVKGGPARPNKERKKIVRKEEEKDHQLTI